MTTLAMNVGAFFRACEDAASRPKTDANARGEIDGDAPQWLRDLAAATAAQLAFDTVAARSLIARARPHVPAGAFRNVLALLELRASVRDSTATGLALAVAPLERLVSTLGAEERPTCARAFHQLAIAQMRLGRVALAEDAMSEALALAEEGPIRMWMADTVAQLLIGQGAWSEAVRTLDALVTKRRAAGDELGLAISAGHLSRLQTQLGRPEQGAATARTALAKLSSDAPLLTRVRLQTLLTSAVLDLEDRAAIEHATEELVPLVEPSAERHYLRGYAMLSLARACGALHDGAGAQSWLERAAGELTLPAHLALLRYHEARIDPRVMVRADWQLSFERVVAATDFVSEGEMKTLLLLVTHAQGAGDEARMQARLAEAHGRATASNNPLWMRWVDELSADLAPEQHSERIALRFSGRSRRELTRTTREDVTIIFADLVSFTPRTLELEPEEVMDTVRGLFELGVPLLTKHRVTPISYMGDGLLALCQGDGHQARGLAFARALVERAGRVSQLRRTLANGWPLDLRAGVASGPVVLGTLGTLFKTEFAAIGVPTNLAARLQSKAEPGEVMCAATTARAASVELPVEAMTLKGFERWNPVEACRIRVYTPEPRSQ